MFYTMISPGVSFSDMKDLKTTEEPNAYARVLDDEAGNTHYYIKAYRSDKTFYDKESEQHSQKTRVGSMMRVNDPYYWQKVNNTVFENYVVFLKTRNKTYKRESERLFQNG